MHTFHEGINERDLLAAASPPPVNSLGWSYAGGCLGGTRPPQNEVATRINKIWWPNENSLRILSNSRFVLITNLPFRSTCTTHDATNSLFACLGEPMVEMCSDGTPKKEVGAPFKTHISSKQNLVLESRIFCSLHQFINK